MFHERCTDSFVVPKSPEKLPTVVRALRGAYRLIGPLSTWIIMRYFEHSNENPNVGAQVLSHIAYASPPGNPRVMRVFHGGSPFLYLPQYNYAQLDIISDKFPFIIRSSCHLQQHVQESNDFQPHLPGLTAKATALY